MTKLISTLQILSPDEFRRLSLYIHSPYFGQHLETIDYFDFLAPHFPEFELDLYAEYQQFRPDTPVTKVQFNLLNSYLLRQVHHFLAQEGLRKRPFLEAELMVDGLRERELFRDAQLKLELALKRMETREEIDGEDLAIQLQQQRLALDLYFSLQMFAGNSPIPGMFRALDELHLTYHLKYLLSAWTLHRVLGQDFPEQRYQECMEKMEREGAQFSILSNIYFRLLLLIREGKEEVFQELNELLDAHSARFSNVERINIYGYLHNYLHQRQAKGDQKALQDLFALFQRMDQEQIIFEWGDFTEHLIRNITITGCRLQEFDWVRQFLEGNQAAIEMKVGKDIYHYTLAFLAFSIQDYAHAKRLLQEIEFKDVVYRTGHQALLLRIYYETNSFEALYSLAHTFRRFLNRSRKISEKKKDLNRNFISAIQWLAKAKDRGATEARRAKVADLLDSDVEITDRSWLEAKLGELWG